MAKKMKVTDGTGDRFAVHYDNDRDVPFFDTLPAMLGIDEGGDLVAKDKKGNIVESRSSHCLHDVARALGAVAETGGHRLKKGVYKITSKRLPIKVKAYKAPRRRRQADDAGGSAAAAESLG